MIMIMIIGLTQWKQTNKSSQDTSRHV